MNTWHIHIQGRVQGVGFRPNIYRLASKKQLNGVVYNDINGVHIKFTAKKETAIPFYKTVLSDAPSLAKITKHSILEIDNQIYEGFQILQNQEAKTTALMLTPDFALCENCRAEVLSHDNRRLLYPFITCTSCGPRFSLINGLPFEREFTVMDEFKMCVTCKEEYTNPENRRYHSQTNSCTTCGIKLSLKDPQGEEIVNDTKEIINKVVDFWHEGKIVVIKGIGGYLLTCDATNSKVINTLRKRKQRPSKPFACMYPNIELIQQEFQTDPSEIKMLLGEVAPIVLFKLKNNQANIAEHEVAPNLDQIGVMLPYTPLYELLMQSFGKPIIATSGNISNASIVFEDDKVFSELSGIWDYVLTNDREIVTSQDDSVVRFSQLKKQRILIRRSRGLSPNYFGPVSNEREEVILAMGASQKSVFGVLYKELFYLSQYLGNLVYFESVENYKRTIDHFMNLLNCRPNVILVDKHPNYHSTEYGKYLTDEYGAKLVSIQHHFAHFASVLSEHSLLTKPEKVLGIIWDGTGFGNDGNNWGGEFLTYENSTFTRLLHLSYVPSILGDKMSLEPRISALVHCWKNDTATEMIRGKFTEQEWLLYQKTLNKGQFLKTSSMGRLFDAVACLLGIMDVQTYEGEAALKLESLAQTYVDQSEIIDETYYVSKISYIENLPTCDIIIGVVKDLKSGMDLNQIAFKFHYSLVKIVDKIARLKSIKKITFSGGVFQNALLVDLMQLHLEPNFQLYFHEEVSPNDENIALGQLAFYQTTNKDEIS